jgi:hypothetical protein
MYHSRGVRRISKLEKFQSQLMDNLSETIQLVKSNQQRIKQIEIQMFGGSEDG